MTRSLDTKLARIRAGDYTPRDFIIADAKDADMAFGRPAPGPASDADGGATGRYRPLEAYRADMRKVLQSGLVDIMLTSLSNAEILMDEGAFSGSDVTPAVRLNDASDIWFARGATYRNRPAAPFRSARLDRVSPVADLGLYAVTFYNDLDADLRTLEAYSRFREEASTAGVRHFLEIFNPHFDVETPDADFASFNNDMIVRALAGVSRRDRPIFLKAAYNGRRATEEIAGYDPANLVFGILGGAAGTTRDCLELLRQAEKHGARVALFGRKIYFAEDSVTMVKAMRRVLEENISSDEGTKAYHEDLKGIGKAPARALEDDLQITEPMLKADADRP